VWMGWCEGASRRCEKVRRYTAVRCSSLGHHRSRRFTPQSPLLGLHEFFRQGDSSAKGWSQLVGKRRDWESFYRQRRQHDNLVRSTHGVNLLHDLHALRLKA
jgi:hypothetical protein